MVMQVDAAVWAALGDSVVESYTAAHAQYQGRSVALYVDPGVGGLTWDADGNVQSSGSLHVVGFGDSLVPKFRDDMLAPYGQEVIVSRVVQLSDRSLTVPLGVYRIKANDGGRESRRLSLISPGNRGEPLVLELDAQGLLLLTPTFFEQEGFLNIDAFPVDADGFFVFEDVREPQYTSPVVLDWEVTVSLADRFRMLERAKIVDPASPPSGSTLYSELQRLTLFPMVRTNPDMQVPQGMVYDDRISAVHELCALTGGKPRLTREGALSIRPMDRWLTETVPDFEIEGTISWDESQTDEFYNIVWAHSDDGRFSWFESLDDDTDPRSVNRAGPSTYEHSSPIYMSNQAAREGAKTILLRLLNRRSRTVKVEVGAQGLLLDLSDVGWIRDPGQGRAVLGEIKGKSVSHDPTKSISLELIVAEEA